MFWTFWMHYNTTEPTVGDAPAIARKSRQHTTSIPSLSHQPSPVTQQPTRVTENMAATFNALARDVYCVLDGEINCHFISDNWSTISGFDIEGEAADGFASHIAPDHVQKLKNYLTRNELDASPLRFQFKHQDGHWHWCELQVGSFEHGHYSCLLKDITEWVNMQSVVEKARLEAELATKSRSEFLANMSHELRTPLNAILGFAQMIESGTYGAIGHPKYNDYINDIQRSGSTLLSKVNDLLEIAEIDAGRMALKESTVDVGQAIRQATEFHSHNAFRKQVALRSHLPEQMVAVRADRIRLLQVLTNLIANAINHSHEDGVVDVYCTVRRDGGVSISVRDAGVGISQAHLDNILNAFDQDNSFFARTRNCVGLGLALSKEIVKLHHGRITIESKQGEGTLITVRLPRERTVAKPRVSKVKEIAAPVEETAQELEDMAS